MVSNGLRCQKGITDDEMLGSAELKAPDFSAATCLFAKDMNRT